MDALDTWLFQRLDIDLYLFEDLAKSEGTAFHAELAVTTRSSKLRKA
jgi:hypothetical protein